MPISFDEYLKGASADSSGDVAAPEETGGWWSRNKGAVALAALGGASLAARRPLGALAARIPAAEQMGRGVQGVFNPTSMPDRNLAPGPIGPIQFRTPEATTAREGEALIRAGFGRAARLSDQEQAKLEPHWPTLNALDPAAKDDFIHYVETRSQGGRIPHPSLQPAADAMREVYKRGEQEILGVKRFAGGKGKPPMEFVEDYYRHMFKPKAGESDADARAAFRRIGEGSFTKHRTFPTIREAKAAGYEPISNDPLEMTTRYVQNMHRFTAREKLLETAENSKLIFKSSRNVKPPQGWEPIFERGLHKFYAPEGFARVWRNFTSPGFTGEAGDVYRPIQQTFNAITAMELGLSGFHAVTMANEGIVNRVANAVTNLAGGKIGAAVKDLVSAPGAPVGLYRRGSEVERAWLGSTPGSHEMARVVELLQRAGGRAKTFKRPEAYSSSGLGSYIEAHKHGALKMQLAEDWKGLKGAGLLTVPWKQVGRTLDTVSAPLFEKYIPRVKNGAFYETMATWLKHNPGAGMAEQERAARMIWDSIDNRFGELVQDNIFWNRTLKQSAMLSLRSYSWALGTLREIGGGVGDLTKGELSQRAAYVVALPIVYGAVNALYQGLKTGQAPEDIQDLMSPRTGGVDAATGLPERLAPIGYMRDVFSWTEDPVRTATSKIATGPRLAGELATGKDWMGLPIADPDAPLKDRVAQYGRHVQEAFTPISLRNEWTRKKGTGISQVETVMGLSPAGRGYVDPEGLASVKQKAARREWKRHEKYKARQESYYDNE